MKRWRWLGVVAIAAACTEEVTFQSDNPWEDPTEYPPIGAGKVIVTNSGDDTLSWIDVETLEVVFTEGVGFYPPEREGPHHGAVHPDGSAYFIGLSNFVPGSGSGPHGSHGTGAVDGYLLKYDMTTHELLADARVSRNPGDVRITPDGRWVLQSHFDLLKIQEALEMDPPGTLDDMMSSLAITDAATMTGVAMVDVCPTGHGIAIASDGSEAYVACWATDELAVVQLAEPFDVERFAVGPGTIDPTSPNYEPYAASVSPADGTVWVSCLRTGDVRIFDPATRTWDETRGPVVTGGAPFFGDFDAAGARYFVPHQGDNRLAVIDTATGNVVQIDLPAAACQAPHGALVLPGEQRLLVVCEGDHRANGTVAVVNLGAGAVEKVLEVGVFPDDLILVAP